MILKSPTHGARVATLRELLPDARFLLIVRDPMTGFESVVRMWHKMFEMYALGPIPLVTISSAKRYSPIALALRRKLAAGTADLPGNRFMKISYESLVANPVEVIEQLYGRLELGDFGRVTGSNRRRNASAERDIRPRGACRGIGGGDGSKPSGRRSVANMLRLHSRDIRRSMLRRRIVAMV